MTITNQKFIITKKIAKHGNQSIIVIPSILKEKILVGMLARITIDLLEGDDPKVLK